MDSPTSMNNNTYLLTLQANCATISQMRKHTTPTRPDYFLFLRESQAKVLTNQSTPFILKQKQTIALHQGWQQAVCALRSLSIMGGIQNLIICLKLAWSEHLDCGVNIR